TDSIIECQSQILAEQLAVAGTPFVLRYQSDRTPGRKLAYTIDIPVTGATVPAPLQRVELEILVAGRDFKQTFSNAANQRTTFVWDGQDAYGRTLQGSQTIVVRTGFVYQGFYQNTTRFGSNGDAVQITSDGTRAEVTLTT